MVVAVGFFFTSMTLLEGQGLTEAQTRLESVSFICLQQDAAHPSRHTSQPLSATGQSFYFRKVRSIYRSYFRGVFVPTQILNFAVIPTHLRFVVVSVVSLFWSKWHSTSSGRRLMEYSRHVFEFRKCTNEEKCRSRVANYLIRL